VFEIQISVHSYLFVPPGISPSYTLRGHWPGQPAPGVHTVT